METWKVGEGVKQEEGEEAQDPLERLGAPHEETHLPMITILGNIKQEIPPSNSSFEESEDEEQWINEELIPLDFQHPPVKVFKTFPTKPNVSHTRNSSLRKTGKAKQKSAPPCGESEELTIPSIYGVFSAIKQEGLLDDSVTGEDGNCLGEINFDVATTSNVNEEAVPLFLANSSSGKPFICKECGYKASRADRLRLHLRTHSGGKPYICTECGYKASRIDHLKLHTRTHSGEKPYCCTECGYKASRAGHLKLHMRTHTGEKPHVCTECDYRTSNASALRTHTRIHSGEKPYGCTECGYRAADPTSLRRHIRTHSGERPHSCTKCGYRASRASHLKNHMKTHVGE